MKFGVALGRLNPSLWAEATMEADRLGFESVWMPEHLVLPAAAEDSPKEGHTLRPETPVFDALAYLSFLAGKTERIKLATHVYNLALRHPFVAARAVATLDVVSGGRAIFGVGAGWLEAEYRAAGIDFATRGRRLDETVDICIKLWTRPQVEHHGEFFDFNAVAFEPKPVQKPRPPIVVGGMSDAAIRRAARVGDGWVAMSASPKEIAARAASIGKILEEHGRSRESFEISTGATVHSKGDIESFRQASATRLIVAPWRSSSDATAALREFAQKYL